MVLSHSELYVFPFCSATLIGPSRHAVLLYITHCDAQHYTHMLTYSSSLGTAACAPTQCVILHVNMTLYSACCVAPRPSVGMVQGLATQLKAREDVANSTERRLEAESRALQQQRQEAELAGMKAQLAVQQQQQQHSPMMSPLLQANPQFGARSASRLQVSTATSYQCSVSGARMQCGFSELCDMLLSYTARDQAADSGVAHNSNLLPLDSCPCEGIWNRGIHIVKKSGIRT